MNSTDVNTALASITTELITIARANWTSYNAWCESEAGILGGSRVRELGIQADRIAGLEGMALACNGIPRVLCDSNEDISLAAACISELNYRWNGIGDWLA